jgi:hypothetical protein
MTQIDELKVLRDRLQAASGEGSQRIWEGREAEAAGATRRRTGRCSGQAFAIGGFGPTT